jgi:hypothetical protein
MPQPAPTLSSTPATLPATLDPPALHAHGQALFQTIFSLVFTVFRSLTDYYQAHSKHDRLSTVSLAIECFASLVALEITLHVAPERVTPRQLLRLSKAARTLTRLTGQTFDFTPWTTLSSDEWTELDRLYPPPTNPYAVPQLRPYELRLPPSGERSAALCLYPGATLAGVIKKLVRILPPDFVLTALQDTADSPARPQPTTTGTTTGPTCTPARETQNSSASVYFDSSASDSSPLAPTSASCPIPP